MIQKNIKKLWIHERMVSHVLLGEGNEERGGTDLIVYLKVTDNI